MKLKGSDEWVGEHGWLSGPPRGEVSWQGHCDTVIACRDKTLVLLVNSSWIYFWGLVFIGQTYKRGRHEPRYLCISLWETCIFSGWNTRVIPPCYQDARETKLVTRGSLVLVDLEQWELEGLEGAGFLSSTGEQTSEINPLQHSCLENPMARGTWRATVHGVTLSTEAT